MTSVSTGNSTDTGFDIKSSSAVFLATLKSKGLPSSTVMTTITQNVQELFVDVHLHMQNTITSLCDKFNAGDLDDITLSSPFMI